MNMWTPLHINILLHYYAIPTPLEMRSETWTKYRQDLIDAGLVNPDNVNGSGFRVSDKGDVWVDALLATPLPIKHWTVKR